ncbi:hypothetical protein B0H19DRAFT_591399 [Mycena capillaripes]|nr:hypothetical protein B0H19DRAFT_591399 [Mycena capillaripes]
MWLPHSFIVLLVAVLASGAITNTTIDDSDSSFTFTGTWNVITPNSPCNGCSSQLNASQTNGGTWHDGNYQDGAPVGTSGSFTFQGSAVYIFGIDQAVSQPDIAFTLGNVQQVHHYTGTVQYVYNALFFSAEGLDPDQTHTVDWVFNLADTGVVMQVALFDYAIVTSGKEDIPTSAFTGVGYVYLSEWCPKLTLCRPAKPKSSSEPHSSYMVSQEWGTKLLMC